MQQFTLNPRKGAVLLNGNFSLSSAAAVSASDMTQLVTSVTKTATGTYTITLTDKWVSSSAIHVSYQGADLNTRAVCTSIDVISAKTIVIKTLVANLVADVSTACVINVSVALKNSSVR